MCLSVLALIGRCYIKFHSKKYVWTFHIKYLPFRFSNQTVLTSIQKIQFRAANNQLKKSGIQKIGMKHKVGYNYEQFLYVFSFFLLLSIDFFYFNSILMHIIQFRFKHILQFNHLFNVNHSAIQSFHIHAIFISFHFT